MVIYDPHAYTSQDLDDCEVTEHTNGLIPVLSTKDERWFVVCMLSGRSQRLEDLHSEDLSAVREAISSHLFSKLLLSHCHQGCESDGVLDKGQAILARVDYARRFGARAVVLAEQRALEVGFTVNDIGTAYNLLEAKDPVVDIPVTKVSDLQKADEVVV